MKLTVGGGEELERIHSAALAMWNQAEVIKILDTCLGEQSELACTTRFSISRRISRHYVNKQGSADIIYLNEWFRM